MIKIFPYFLHLLNIAPEVYSGAHSTLFKQPVECTLDIFVAEAINKWVGQRCNSSVHYCSYHILILRVLRRRLEVYPNDGAIEKSNHGEVGSTGGDCSLASSS
jgi:hypothetical protein